MAQLKDTIVSGNLRVTDTTLTDTLQVTTIKAPTSSGGSTYGPGTSGQVLTSYGSSTYWGAANNHSHNYAGSSSAGGAATSANKLNTNAGSTNRPVYFSGGVPVQCDTPASGSWFKGVPLITTDGVMEFGKYIDFHNTNGSTADYDYRMEITTTTMTLHATGSSNTLTIKSPGNAQLSFQTTSSGKAYTAPGITCYPLTDTGITSLFNFGGNLVIGGGESAKTLYDNNYDTIKTAENETLYLASDSAELHLITDAQTYAGRKVLKILGGQLTKSGGSWISARDNAPVYSYKGGDGTSSSFFPAIFSKSKTGGWAIGTIGNTDNFYVSYTTDANYSSDTNTSTYTIQFPKDSGTLALTSSNITGTAAAWTTARTLTLGGKLTGSVSVKGNANMTLNGYLDRAFIYDDNAVPDGHTWAEYAWHKFAEVTIATTYTDCVITFLVSRTFSSSAENAGILSAKLRTNGSKSYESAQLKWLVRNYGLSKDDFVMVYTSTSGTSTKAELWCRLPEQYSGLIFTVLKEHKRQYSTDVSWTLVKTPDESGSTHGSSSYPTTGITGTIISSDGTITNSTTGTATSANALNLTNNNELNFSKLAETGHVWFGYRWNTQGTETSGDTTITKYKFGNATGSPSGLAGLEASTSTFKSGNFGDQLIVERTGGANMAGIAFKNTSGVLGYIAANTVDGDLYHYGATDTSTMKYVILDSHNYTSYALASTTKYAGSTSVGGAANSANVLNKNTRMDYGWDGVNYFNINGTAGNAAKVNDTPTTAWWHIMRFNNYNTSGYYTDLAIPFGTTSLYYKRITAGSVQNGGWVKVLDALNVGYMMSSVIKYDSHARRFTSSKTDAAWNAQAYSNTGYADNVYVSFRAGQTTMYAMIGLDANPSEDDNYDKIDYCWYIQNNGALKVYESGTAVTITGHTTYASGDEFRVEYSCGEIRYYHNGTMCRSVTRAVSGKLFFDSSFHNAGNVYDFSYGTSTHSTHTAEIITSTYKSSTSVASLTSSVITLSDAASSFGGWICGPTKNGRIAISSYQGSDDKLYFGYGERGRTTNSYAKAMKWDGPTNTLTADKFVGALQGNAATATKLETARNIALADDFAGSADFDGSGNISISGTFYRCSATSNNTANYPWHRIAYRTGVTGVYSDTDAIFMIRAYYNGGPFGIIKVTMRTNGSGANCQVAARWLVRQNIAANDVYIAQWGKTGQSVYADIFLKGTTYNRAYVHQIAGSRLWTLVNSNEASDTTTSDKKTSTEVYASIAAAGTTLHNQAYTQILAGIDEGHVNSANSAATATRADCVNVVAGNEIRFYNNNQFTANNQFWLGYSWAAGSHYTPSGGSDTSSTTAPNITKFIMGNCSAGGLASVHAKTFILGNGSSPTYSSKTTTIATAATTTDRTITLPDASGTLGVAEILFNTPTNSTDPVSLSSTPLSDYNYFTIIFSMNGANSDNSSSAIVPAVEGKHFALFRVNETTEYMMFPITIIISTYGNATAFGTLINRGISIPYSGSSVSIVSARTAYIKMIIGHKS